MADRENLAIAGSKSDPLCVDLDGTILRTDTLSEYLVVGIHQWSICSKLIAWLFQGKAKLKAQLARHIKLDPALLPYNTKLLEYLHVQKKQGRSLVMVTAANRNIAEAINEHIGLFDEVIASGHLRNLRGREKAMALVERFGERGFSYAGNDRTDLDVWACARSGILVNTPHRIAMRAGDLTPIEACFNDKANSKIKALLRELRPYQWVKNLLVFVPMLAANALGDPYAILNALYLFLAFCSVASAIYIINDLYDLEADRRHPKKKDRPIASGDLSIAAGVVSVPILLSIGLALSLTSTVPIVTVLLMGYGAASIIYSLKLKEFPLVDVFMLSALYSVRVFAGGEATGYHVSTWLLAFSGFLFLSLSMLKRTSELRSAMAREKQYTSIARRGYTTEDLYVMQSFGIASSFLASLVAALYIQHNVEMRTYLHSEMLWLAVPLILFWQCRLWLATSRGYMHDDPIVYTSKDWVSWLVILLTMIIYLIGSIKVPG